MPRRPWFPNLIFAALLGAAFFLTIALSSPDIAGGDDAYRHVRFAHRLATETRSALADPGRLPYVWPKPVDIWFGFHALLAPLTLAFSLITAAKVMGAGLWAAAAFVLLQLLDQLGARWSRAWVVLAMTGSALVLYRAALVRPFLLSLLLVMLATRYVTEERARPLGVVSFLHAISYSIFFLPAFPAGVYFLLRRSRRTAGLIAACGIGLLLGVAVSPFFPENAKFALAQAYAPLKIGTAQQLDIGMELKPITAWWLAASLPVFAVWIPALIVVATTFRRRPPTSAQCLLLAMSVISLAVSFRASRMLDFFVPLAVLFAATVLSPWIELQREKALYGFGFLFLICAAGLVPAFATLRAAPSLARYRGASEFLSRQADGALVFNTHWEQYPFLYFWNWRSRYITGMDPTFLYLNSSRRYWLWRHLSDDSPVTCGRPACAAGKTEALEDVIREFGASYVFVDRQMNPGLTAALRLNTRMSEAYQDSSISVFAITSGTTANKLRYNAVQRSK